MGPTFHSKLTTYRGGIYVIWTYRKFCNIRHTKSQKLKWFSSCLAVVFAQCIEASCKVVNKDVVGAALTGNALTTSEWLTSPLPTKMRLILEVWQCIIFNDVALPPTVHPKNYVHDSHLVVNCCGLVPVNFIYIHVIHVYPMNNAHVYTLLCFVCYGYIFSSCEFITVTSLWARWRLKSPALRLSTPLFIQAQIKENIKTPCHWPLWGEFTDDRWILSTKGQ